MAVAKGATIPKARVLDAVEATGHALATFERWADVHASALQPDVDGKAPQHDVVTSEVDRMQILLAAWQADRFANAPTSDVHMALGVIEELGEAFDEDAGPEDAVDALGDVMVYAAQLCTRNRLAVRPVIDLAILYHKANLCHPQPICLAGMLAHIALKHDQGIRGLGPMEAYRPRLVDALALMIAKALEDCTIGHELQIDPAGVFLVIGAEVMGRKAGDAMIPKKYEATTQTVPFEQARPSKSEALAEMRDAIDTLDPVADPAANE